MTYKAPLAEIQRALYASGIDDITKLPTFENAGADVVASILAEAAKLAENVIAPLNRAGDNQPAKLVNGKVEVPPGWPQAWAELAKGGWVGLSAPAEHGGMAMPELLGLSVSEMWNSANLAFALCPLLTQGAAHAISLYGNAEQKTRLLPPMNEGRWTGTMNLTEPQAGSDLAALRTAATPDGSHYRIKGQKIYITYGDHEMTENIVHLVLARLPDAPAGVKGISLFVVQKFHDGKRNTVHAASLEHKLGIHGSPTAVMIYDDAVGELIGQPHRGLEYMFAMMNHARLDVGVQGLAVAERGFQMALAYARERVQGKPVGFVGEGKATIIHHPDVHRLLISMRARIAAMRGLLYEVAAARDMALAHPDEATRAAAQFKVDLLTPIAKGWCTEVGNEVVYDAVQIFGGMGFIEDTGIAQVFRDARILPIYEGTTAIQANALVGRSLLRDKGESLLAYLKTFSNAAGVSELVASAQWIIAASAKDQRLAYAASVPFLHQFGTVLGGIAVQRQGGNVAACYNAHLGPRALSFHHQIVSGTQALYAQDFWA